MAMTECREAEHFFIGNKEVIFLIYFRSKGAGHRHWVFPWVGGMATSGEYWERICWTAPPLTQLGFFSIFALLNSLFRVPVGVIWWNWLLSSVAAFKTSNHINAWKWFRYILCLNISLISQILPSIVAPTEPLSGKDIIIIEYFVVLVSSFPCFQITVEISRKNLFYLKVVQIYLSLAPASIAGCTVLF